VGRVKKYLEDYEREAVRVGECLIHPSKSHDIARRVYKLRHKAPPSHILVCHTCDVPQCINDDHHFLGTKKDNAQDASKKGRMVRSADTCAKLSKTKKDWAKTPEGLAYLAVMVEAARAPAARAKNSAAKKGVLHTAEHNIKIGNAGRGKPKPETFMITLRARERDEAGRWLPK
jgi:hypothetical protein